MTVIKHPAGQPSWADLGTPDVDAARAFYSVVMDWTTTEGSDQ